MYIFLVVNYHSVIYRADHCCYINMIHADVLKQQSTPRPIYLNIKENIYSTVPYFPMISAAVVLELCCAEDCSYFYSYFCTHQFCCKLFLSIMLPLNFKKCSFPMLSLFENNCYCKYLQVCTLCTFQGVKMKYMYICKELQVLQGKWLVLTKILPQKNCLTLDTTVYFNAEMGKFINFAFSQFCISPIPSSHWFPKK